MVGSYIVKWLSVCLFVFMHSFVCFVLDRELLSCLLVYYCLLLVYCCLLVLIVRACCLYLFARASLRFLLALRFAL